MNAIIIIGLVFSIIASLLVGFLIGMLRMIYFLKYSTKEG